MSTERIKTSMMLPRKILSQMDTFRAIMGIGKNAFLSMGVCFMLVTVARLSATPKKRRIIINEVASEFQRLVDSALEDA